MWYQQLKAVVFKNLLLKRQRKHETGRALLSPSIALALCIAADYASSSPSRPSALSLLPFYLPLAFALYVRSIILTIVGEKKSKRKDALQVMGLRPSAYWCGYFISESMMALEKCFFFGGNL